MVHFKRILLVCIVSAAVPATLAVVDGRVDGARLARVHLKIGKGYPGAMLQEYLGTNISPRERRTVLAPYEANISSCMTIEGHIYSNSVADPTPVDELRVADPEAFGKRYAYGFTVSLNAQDVQGHDPSTDGGGRLEASVEYAATLQEIGRAHV